MTPPKPLNLLHPTPGYPIPGGTPPRGWGHDEDGVGMRGGLTPPKKWVLGSL